MTQPSDSSIVVTPSAVLDSSQVTTGAGIVQRERVAIGDANAGGQVANVTPAGDITIDGGAILAQNERIIELLELIAISLGAL